MKTARTFHISAVTEMIKIDNENDQNETENGCGNSIFNQSRWITNK